MDIEYAYTEESLGERVDGLNLASNEQVSGG